MTSIPAAALGRGRRRGVAGRGTYDRPGPASAALATATTMPRSLNEPVGFWPSTLRYRLRSPSAAPRRSARTSGVKPSPVSTPGSHRSPAGNGGSARRAVAVSPACVICSVIDRVPDAAGGRGGRARGATGVAGARAPRSRSPGRARRRRDRDEVAQDGRRGRSAAGARTVEPTRPTGTASISIRLRTPAVRPRAESSGSAVGRTAAARRRRRRRRPSRASRMIRPASAGVGLVGQADRRDARPGGTVGAIGSVGIVAGSSHRSNASRARMTSLLTASWPSTSPAGSASA